MKSLSQHLKPLSYEALLDIAERAGVTPRIAANAQRGEKVCADSYLRISNASGFDPVTGGRITPSVVGGFNLNLLARDVRFKRALDKQRAVAQDMGVSRVAICRLEKAHTTSLETVLKACAYLGVHPFEYMRGNVARETTEHDRIYGKPV
jgi:transcriptional regulator with XRE-family HTH domain